MRNHALLSARLPLPALLSVVLLAVATACRTSAVATARGTWHEIKSPRFSLYTDGDPERARRLVLELEQFHHVLATNTTFEERTDAPPLRIFLAKDPSSLRAWTQTDHVGLFAATHRGNYALVSVPPLFRSPEAVQLTGREVLFHEYTHYVMAAQGARVPSWYNEGFAEYMASTAFDDDGSYTLGCPPRYRTQWMQALRWVPIRRVMEAENVATLASGSLTDSYAQSWYAVHYFNRDSDSQSQLGHYLRLYGEGAVGEDAVKRAFGASYDQLDDRIRRHASLPTLDCVRVTPSESFEMPAVHVRPISKAEAHYRVGDLLLALSGATGAAMDLLEQAAKLEPENARTLIALARAHLLRAVDAALAKQEAAHTTVLGDPEPLLRQAETYLQQAEALVTDDPEGLTIAGHIAQLRAERLAERTVEAVAPLVAAARAAYRKAIRKDDTLAEAYVGLGSTYLLLDNGSEEAVSVLEAAAYLLPLDASIALTLAQLHLQRGRHLEAIPAAQYALRWSKSEHVRKQARQVIETLRQLARSSD